MLDKNKLIPVIIIVIVSLSVSTAFAVGGTNIIFKTSDGSTSHEVMKITSDQKVGIGTSLPQEALDVNGSVHLTGAINCNGCVTTTDLAASAGGVLNNELYQSSVRQLCFLSNAACDFSFSPVPLGKRLVITHVSGYFSSRQTAEKQFIFVSIRDGANDDEFLPTSFQGNASGTTSIFVFNQEIQKYYDSGSTPVVRIMTGDRGYPILSPYSLPSNNIVTISGYMVDHT